MANFSPKKFSLVISKILRPFVNTLTSYEKYFHGNRENLRQAIQMQLSKKLKIFLELLTAFPKSAFNFQDFGNKDESHSLCISKVIECEIRAYGNV